MLLGARTATMGAKPYDREVAWIGGTGTQYLDFGFVPTANTRIVTKCAYSSGTDLWRPLIGNYQEEGKAVYMIQYRSVGISVYGYYPLSGAYGSYNFIYDTSDHVYNISAGKIVVDGGEEHISTVGTDGGTLSLYGFTYPSEHPSNSNAKGRIYYLQHYENDTLVDDFIPVVKSIDGVDTGFMYNRIKKTFVGNLGTGAFTWGELSA